MTHGHKMIGMPGRRERSLMSHEMAHRARLALDNQPYRSTPSKASSTWLQLIAAHTEAMRRYELAANAAKQGAELEDEVDIVLGELAQIEQRALSEPAPDVVALRFKLRLWANSRVEDHDDDWRILAQDCERFLP